MQQQKYSPQQVSSMAKFSLVYQHLHPELYREMVARVASQSGLRRIEVEHNIHKLARTPAR